MQAIREIKKIKDKKIVVNLPEDFQAKEVEVIILPEKHVDLPARLLTQDVHTPPLRFIRI